MLERAIGSRLAPACVLFDDRFRTLYALGAGDAASPCAMAPGTNEMPAVVTISFGAADPGTQLLLNGWGLPAQAWTSTVRSRARLVLPIPAPARRAGDDIKVTFDFDIVRPDPDRGTRISITLAGSAPHVIEIPAGAPTPHQAILVVPKRALGQEPFAVIALRISDSERQSNSTGRDLGLTEIRLKSAEVKALPLRPDSQPSPDRPKT